jgi:hypothetical protein
VPSVVTSHTSSKSFASPLARIKWYIRKILALLEIFICPALEFYLLNDNQEVPRSD